MYNAVASAVMNETTPVNIWNSSVLDKILKDGDWLCHNAQSDGFPLIQDLPKEIWIRGDQYNLSFSESESGSLIQLDEHFPTLQGSIHHISKYGILTIGTGTPAYSCAIIKDSLSYFIFDPHARDSRDMACPDGKAVLTYHTKIDDLIQFLNLLSESLGAGVAFELTPLSICKEVEPQGIIINLSRESSETASSSDDENPLSLYVDIKKQVELKRNSKLRAEKML